MSVGAGALRWRPSAVAIVVITHPLVVGSLATLAVNDRVGKVRWPGPLTGVASDLAGLVLLPVLLAVLVDAMRGEAVRWEAVAWMATGVAVSFAAVEVLPVADAAYEHGFGLLGWPVRALLGEGGSTRVVATADPADLLALPFAAIGPLLWRRAERAAQPAAAECLVAST